MSLRIHLSVSDSARRVALVRLLRADAGVTVVAHASDADVVVTDADQRQTSVVAREPRGHDALVPATPGQTLTPREREVLVLVSSGLGNTRIGDRLGISKSTVKYHLGAIFTKLGVHTRAEAVTIGIRSGLVLL